MVWYKLGNSGWSRLNGQGKGVEIGKRGLDVVIKAEASVAI